MIFYLINNSENDSFNINKNLILKYFNQLNDDEFQNTWFLKDI